MIVRNWFLLAGIAAAGCGGYEAPSEVTRGSLVYTQPAPGASFTPLRTYYLDPNMEVWQDGAAQPSQAVPPSSVTTMNARMAAYGYTAVTTPPPPTAHLPPTSRCDSPTSKATTRTT